MAQARSLGIGRLKQSKLSTRGHNDPSPDHRKPNQCLQTRSPPDTRARVSHDDVDDLMSIRNAAETLGQALHASPHESSDEGLVAR
jgi:hypothetical protein